MKITAILCTFFLLLAVPAFCQEGVPAAGDTLSSQTADSTAAVRPVLKRASVDYEGGIYWASTPDSLYVLVDSTGTVLTKMKYQEVYPFQDGIAYVKRNLSIGFVNSKGVEVGRCIFDWAPAEFGRSQFLYHKGSERISPMHNPTSYIWVSETGKFVHYSKKYMFTIADKIPDALWDY